MFSTIYFDLINELDFIFESIPRNKIPKFCSLEYPDFDSTKWLELRAIKNKDWLFLSSISSHKFMVQLWQTSLVFWF